MSLKTADACSCFRFPLMTWYDNSYRTCWKSVEYKRKNISTQSLEYEKQNLWERCIYFLLFRFVININNKKKNTSNALHIFSFYFYKNTILKE